MLMTEASMAKLLFQESSLDPRIRDFFLFYFLFSPNHRVPLVQKYVSHILQASTHFDNSFSLLLFSYRSLCSWFRLIRVTLLNKLLHISAKVFFTTEYTKKAAVNLGEFFHSGAFIFLDYAEHQQGRFRPICWLIACGYNFLLPCTLYHMQERTSLYINQQEKHWRLWCYSW